MPVSIPCWSEDPQGRLTPCTWYFPDQQTKNRAGGFHHREVKDG